MVQVDAPEALHRGGEVSLHVLLARDVGRDARAADLLRHPRGAVIVDVHGHDLRALARQASRRSSAEAAGGAGHHRDLARQPSPGHSPIMIPARIPPSTGKASPEA